METKFNKKIHTRRRRLLPPDWQDKLPVKPLLFLLVLTLLVVLLMWLNEPGLGSISQEDLELLRNRGGLKLGVDSSLYGLYEEGVGLEADIAAALSEFLYEDTDSCQPVPLTRQSIHYLFADGEIHMSLCSLSALSGKEYTATTHPFYQDPVVLVGYENAGISGKKVAGLSGTDSYKLLEKHQKEQDASLLLYPYAAYYDMLVALRAGRVDYCAMPRTAALSYKDEDMLLLPGSLGSIEYHVILPVQEKLLKELMDELLLSWAREGKLSQWYEKHGLLYE